MFYYKRSFFALFVVIIYYSDKCTFHNKSHLMSQLTLWPSITVSYVESDAKFLVPFRISVAVDYLRRRLLRHHILKPITYSAFYDIYFWIKMISDRSNCKIVSPSEHPSTDIIIILIVTVLGAILSSSVLLIITVLWEIGVAHIVCARSSY